MTEPRVPDKWVDDIKDALFPIPRANQEQELIAKQEAQAFWRFKVFAACMAVVFLLFIASQVA